jgi:hypothetical protein
MVYEIYDEFFMVYEIFADLLIDRGCWILTIPKTGRGQSFVSQQS